MPDVTYVLLALGCVVAVAAIISLLEKSGRKVEDMLDTKKEHWGDRYCPQCFSSTSLTLCPSCGVATRSHAEPVSMPALSHVDEALEDFEISLWDRWEEAFSRLAGEQVEIEKDELRMLLKAFTTYERVLPHEDLYALLLAHRKEQQRLRDEAPVVWEPLDMARLNFARWLYETGRLTEHPVYFRSVA